MRKLAMLFISLIIFCVGVVVLGFVTGKSKNDTSIITPAEILDAIPEELAQVYVSPIDIKHLRAQNYVGSDITIEEELSKGSNYKRYIASYMSEGNKIYGLLTVPDAEAPEGGYKAIVFNHGYIPPQQYVTTEKYVSYVDVLARNGFVVFKIDLRGHGKSEGRPTGSYFSPSYTIDAINALKSLQRFDVVNPERIGMWGHSMSGNLVLRAMLVSDEVKAGVIWAGAVFSYEDLAKYGISDNSYVPRRPDPTDEEEREEEDRRESSPKIQDLWERSPDLDFTEPFWKSISLTQNLNYISGPVQIHHALNDNVVNVGYARDLAKALEENGKDYELYEYDGGGHNIDSPYFDVAIRRTVEFFDKNL